MNSVLSALTNTGTMRPRIRGNVFAAEILLDDKEVLELAKDGFDEEQISSALNMDAELLLIKMNEMNKRGARFRMSRVPSGGFLGK